VIAEHDAFDGVEPGVEASRVACTRPSARGIHSA